MAEWLSHNPVHPLLPRQQVFDELKARGVHTAVLSLTLWGENSRMPRLHPTIALNFSVTRATTYIETSTEELVHTLDVPESAGKVQCLRQTTGGWDLLLEDWRWRDCRSDDNRLADAIHSLCRGYLCLLPMPAEAISGNVILDTKHQQIDCHCGVTEPDGTTSQLDTTFAWQTRQQQGDSHADA